MRMPSLNKASSPRRRCGSCISWVPNPVSSRITRSPIWKMTQWMGIDLVEVCANGPIIPKVVCSIAILGVMHLSFEGSGQVGSGRLASMWLRRFGFRNLEGVE